MKTTSSPTSTKWEGRWEQLTGKAKGLWGKLTNDDLLETKGDYERLIGRIKEVSGETAEEIERKLNA